MKNNKILIIVSLASVFILGTFLVFLNIVDKKREVIHKSWQKEVAKIDQQFSKQNNIIEKSINGRVVYSYSDSSKLIKTGVLKDGYDNSTFSISINNDTLSLQKDSLILIITSVESMPVDKINVFLTNDFEQSTLLKSYKIISNTMGKIYFYKPKKRGLNKVEIEFTNKSKLYIKEYNFIVI